MPAEGLGPEIAAAHVLVTASFDGMSAAARRQATQAAREFGSAGSRAGSAFVDGTAAPLRRSVAAFETAGAKSGSAFGGGFHRALGNLLYYAGPATVATNLANGLKAATSAGIKFDSTVEQARIGLAQFTGSAASADREIQFLKKFDLESGQFTFSGALRLDQQLLAVTRDGKLAHEILKTVGDAAAGTGRGTEAVAGLSLALSQMVSKGKIQAQEATLQMGQYGIAVAQILSAQTGKTAAEINDMMQKGKLDSATYVPLLLKGIEAQFKDLDKKSTTTMAGMWNNLGDVLERKLGEAEKPLFDNLKHEVGSFAKWIDGPEGTAAIKQFGDTMLNVAEGVETGIGLVRRFTPELKALAEVMLLRKGASWLTSLSGALGARAGGVVASMSAQARSVNVVTAAIGGYRSATMGAATVEREAAPAMRTVTAALSSQATAYRLAAEAAYGYEITAKTASAVRMTPTALNSRGDYPGFGPKQSQIIGPQTSMFATMSDAEFAKLNAASGAGNRLAASLKGAARQAAVGAPMLGLFAQQSGLLGESMQKSSVATNVLFGASAGAMFGPWGAAIGGATGAAKSAIDALTGSSRRAYDALQNLSSAKQWEQVQSGIAAFRSDVDLGGDRGWFIKGLDFISGTEEADVKNFANELNVLGVSTRNLELDMKAGGKAWDDWYAKASKAAGSDNNLHDALNKLNAGVRSYHEALRSDTSVKAQIANDNLISSLQSLSGSTYTSVKALVSSAQQAGVTGGMLNVLAAAARSVPAGGTINFSTNAALVAVRVAKLRAELQAIKAGTYQPQSNQGYVGALIEQLNRLKKDPQEIRALEKQLAAQLQVSPIASIIPAATSGGSAIAKVAAKYDPFAEWEKQFKKNHHIGWWQASGRSIASSLIRGFGDEITKRGTIKLDHGKLAKWAKGTAQELRSEFADAVKGIQSKIASLQGDLKSARSSFQSTWNSGIFDQKGSTDYFGKYINGSAAKAAAAIATSNGATLSKALKDEATLKKALGGQVGSNDFINSLFASGNFAQISDLSANTALARSLEKSWETAQQRAAALYNSSPAGVAQAKQLAMLNTQLKQSQAMVSLMAALLKLQADEQIANKEARTKAIQADTKIINGALKNVGAPNVSSLLASR